MDPHRRSMMPPPDFHGGRSNIPVPATTKRQPAPSLGGSGRPSLAGPLRTPYSGQGSGGHRQSMYRSQGQNPLLQSASKPTFGRTPLNNSTRRTSLWPGAAAASSSTQVTKDTRPLRDKAYQSTMRQDVLAYLQKAGVDISMSTLTNIQAKDYRSIFDYLILTLDPLYNLPDPNKTKLEDYFKQTITNFRYPYVSQIDSKWLVAPASMHSWPSLLGVLHWFVKLCENMHHYHASGDPTLQITSDIPEEFDDPIDHKALVFEMYQQMYSLWLEHQDDKMEEVKIDLERRYNKKNENIQDDLEEKRAAIDKAKVEYEKLRRSATPISTIQNEIDLLKVDHEKFQKILKQYDIRKTKIIDTIAHEKAELARKEDNLAQAASELDRLNDVVKSQNLTPEEVIRMTTDHETLARNLEDLKQNIARTHSAVMSLEVNVTNRATSTEEELDTYTSMLSALGLFPPLPPPLEGVNFVLELNTATSDPSQLLIGSDIKTLIKPNLNLVAETKRMERADVENERLRADHELDQLMTECENLDLDTSELDKKVAALNQQADDLRDTAQQEALVASKEIERLERDLAHARKMAQAHGMGAKHRLQALQIEYQEQTEKVSKLKDQTVRAIVKSSHDIAMFKAEVSKHLMEMKEFAETQVS